MTNACFSQDKLSYAAVTSEPEIPVAYNGGSVSCSSSCSLWVRWWLCLHHHSRTKEMRIWQRHLPPGRDRHPPCLLSLTTSKLKPGRKFKATTCPGGKRIGMLLNIPNDYQSILVSIHTRQLVFLRTCNALSCLRIWICNSFFPKCLASPCYFAPTYTSYYLKIFYCF